MGKMIAIILASTMPGHLGEPGNPSDTQEFISEQTIEMMLI